MTLAPRHGHRLLTPLEVNALGLPGNWFWWAGLVACKRVTFYI